MFSIGTGYLAVSFFNLFMFLYRMEALVEKSRNSKRQAGLDVCMMIQIVSRCSLRTFAVIHFAIKEMQQLSYQSYVVELHKERTVMFSDFLIQWIRV